MNKQELKIYNLVREELSDELIPDNYKNLIPHKMCGHCHHASLAMYNLLGGKEAGYKLQKVEDELGIIHYWLLNPNNEIIDPTAEQYIELNRKLPYSSLKDNKASYRKTKATKIIIRNVLKKINEST